MTEDPKTQSLLEGLEELAAVAQNGLAFSKDQYDIERFQRARVLVSELMAGLSNLSADKIHKWLELEANYATPKIDVRGAGLPRR